MNKKIPIRKYEEFVNLIPKFLQEISFFFLKTFDLDINSINFFLVLDSLCLILSGLSLFRARYINIIVDYEIFIIFFLLTCDFLFLTSLFNFYLVSSTMYMEFD